VTLGYDTFAGYLEDESYFGCLVGRRRSRPLDARGRLLLGQAVQRAQAPDEVDGVDAGHRAVGDEIGEQADGGPIRRIVEGGHDHGRIGDVEVCVARGQPLAGKRRRGRHGQGHDLRPRAASGLGVTVIPYAAIAADMRTRRFAWARVRGRRLYRETGWVYLKSDYVPRAIPEMLRVFDSIKDQFGGKPPGK